MNQGWTYQEKVNTQGAGQTLLDYYCQNYQHSSREEWQDRILAGQILINHEKANPETILKKGQQLTYQRSPWEEPDVPLDFATLYEDADLMIIAKPSGLPVLPGGGFLQNTLCIPLTTSPSEYIKFEINHYCPYNSGNNIMKYTVSGLTATGSYIFSDLIYE